MNGQLGLEPSILTIVLCCPPGWECYLELLSVQEFSFQLLDALLLEDELLGHLPIPAAVASRHLGTKISQTFKTHEHDSHTFMFHHIKLTHRMAALILRRKMMAC